MEYNFCLCTLKLVSWSENQFFESKNVERFDIPEKLTVQSCFRSKSLKKVKNVTKMRYIDPGNRYIDLAIPKIDTLGQVALEMVSPPVEIDVSSC